MGENLCIHTLISVLFRNVGCWKSYKCLIESESFSVVSYSLWPHGLYSPWNSPGQNTGVGSLSLFQGIFPTQGLNPGLLHCRQILYQLSHKGSPSILEWVAYPFSRESSWPRNLTGASCIAGDSLPTELSGKLLGSITMKKVSGGDRIPAELFQILKDDAVKVLHLICQQMWKTQQ